MVNTVEIDAIENSLRLISEVAGENASAIRAAIFTILVTVAGTETEHWFNQTAHSYALFSLEAAGMDEHTVSLIGEATGDL